jgi:hypothetical protein
LVDYDYTEHFYIDPGTGGFLKDNFSAHCGLAL